MMSFWMIFFGGLAAAIGLLVGVVYAVSYVVSPQPGRTLVVVLRSLAVSFVLAVVSYSVFYAITAPVYDSVTGDGLVAFQAIFCAAFVLHVLSSLVVTKGLIGWTQAPVYPTFAVVLVMYAVFSMPLLWALSLFNYCVTDVSFPIPGLTNCGND